MKKKFKYGKEFIIGMFLAFIIIMIISKFYFVASIPSASMDDTLVVGDRLIIKNNIDADEINVGSIYVFNKEDTIMIKRCIGVEGDHIQVKDNDVFRNGNLLNEEYVSSSISSDQSFDIDIIVPKGKVFFLGDNRRVSRDARYWEDMFVDESEVFGKALNVFFPPSHIKNLD